MASIVPSSISVPRFSRSALRSQGNQGVFGLNSISFSNARNFILLRSARLRVSCAAKLETVEKVAAIVKKQLALGDDQVITGESKFSALGADSLDTVEIVMGLEEEFGISVEEESAQNITTVQDAADMIEKLVGNKSG